MKQSPHKSFHKKKYLKRRFKGKPPTPSGHPSRIHRSPQSHKSPHPHKSASNEVVEGILQVKGKSGFVLSTDPQKGDVLIQGPSLALAMNGDRVKARVDAKMVEGRRRGVLTQVMVRARDTVVGTFKLVTGRPALFLDEDTMVKILDVRGFRPKTGDIVVVRITRWPTLKEGLAGTLTAVLGPKNAPGVDFKEVLHRHNLPTKFPAPVEAEAASFGAEVPESSWQASGRQQFFDQRAITIDGADAKDFDDAVSIQETPQGWRLGVHIADVAHYVREGTDLDKEALLRGTSVYFPGSVIPMLPFPLSNGLCSLRPDCIRLTLSCMMEIDRSGRVTHAQIVESAIKSARRFTYEEVEKIIRGDNPPDVDPDMLKDLRQMETLAQLLRKKRFERGSLDFDFPEPDIELDPHGRPIDISRKDRLQAHRLIEDFMLLANETVASHMKGQPFLYRIHETPDPTRVEKLLKSVRAVGLPVPKMKDTAHPSFFSAILASAEGKPVQSMIHLMILRSLKQAVYSPVDKGHFGLASKTYTHFTSPIRRYPDLIVHRILKERIRQAERPNYWKSTLQPLCEQASQRERVAVEAEREFMDIQKVRLMEKYVGETFTGTVSSVTNFGIFVELDKYLVHGIIHISNLASDYFVFDEHRQTLTGRRSGHVYALGQKVKVQVASANVLKRQIDFELLDAPKPRKRFPHKRPPHRRHRKTRQPGR